MKRMMAYRAVAVAVLGAALSISATAEVLASEYQAAMQSARDKPAMLLYISGVGTGFGWANETNTYNKVRPLYCQPETLSMNAQNFTQILDARLAKVTAENRAIGKSTDMTKLHAEFELLRGLEQTFPCQ
ncbi:MULTISPECIES: hypothetical protein [unclassified Variovorax]|uniref:hypothetical protein n=1 Tax=unclassified Variovorax TaxID=663243 RepID=UPI0008381780|nr:MULTISPECIES: hypothetical protein [unclassified Variovorax]PNG50410.1 hypothetical protein CHC06_06034 [Variovorax sp. B2]PNG51283.1 hypothetical protein CHC07_05940 [Variovorax sp. B4]VTU43213.1 hypothetical protein SRS16P1_00466 [Variovorax sp. SRS16]VTU43243.1 hypothetical protein E5P1_00463 [Variovorax sp. PBL-E5]VTU43377.1 hypothetical protein H6P1_00440 [Variovorax sp. PBL-H6]